MSLVITHNAVLTARDCSPVLDRYARMCWNNKVDTVTASSEQTDYEDDNLLSDTTYQYWVSDGNSPTVSFTVSGAVSFVGLANTNLNDVSGTVKLESYDGTNYTTLGELMPSSNRPIVFIFDEIEPTSFRLTFTTDDDLSLAILQAGDVLAFECDIDSGFVDMRLMQDVTLDQNVSEGGQFLGAKLVRTSLTGEPQWSRATFDWCASSFYDFYEYTKYPHPFFFIPNPKMRPESVYFTWMNSYDVFGDRSRQFLPITLDLEAFLYD